MDELKEIKLIFIISQPRAGSSMLQQIVSSHSKISSLPEPWLMLPFAYLLKQDVSGNIAPYNYRFFHINFHQYINNFSNGKNKLVNILRTSLSSLYQIGLDENTEYFLDKTPRYYHIIQQIKEIFPKSKIIILRRSPLSVFASILSYNFRGKISRLRANDRIEDLLTAPKELIKYKGDSSFFFLNYESIVTEPEKVLPELFKYLHLSTDEHLLKGNYIVDPIFVNSKHVDQRAATKNTKPSPNYLHSWKESIDDLQKKKLALQYIKTLGRDTIEALGYSYDEIIHDIGSHRVKLCIPVINFKTLTNNNVPEILKLSLIALYRLQKKVLPWLKK